MQKLQDYLALNGITMDKISIQRNENGYYIRAEQDLNTGDVVAKIPKEAVLSIRNSAIADLIEELEYGGVLGLCFAVVYEMSLGEKSPWYEYFELVDIPSLPLSWKKEEALLLAGTDVGRSLEEDRLFITEDFNELVLPLVEKYEILKKEWFTLENWFKAHALVSSRAFSVDSFHGDSIVPLADLFNHHYEENVHFEDWDVCEECGAAEGTCACALGSDVDNESLPELEVDEVPELEGENSVTLETDEVDTTVLEMTIVKPVKKGEEVFNTYGTYSNASLLRLYGFVIEGNPNSTVMIEKEEVLGALETISENLPDRVAFWDQVGKDILDQLKDMEEETEEEEGCAEGESGCCVDGVCTREMKGDDEQWEDEVDEGEDMEADDDDEQVPDDFHFERKSPSYALLVFVSILLMSESDFEDLATDLEAAIKFFVSVKNHYDLLQEENLSKGKGGASVLFGEVHAILRRVAQNRLAGYPVLNDEKPITPNTKLALILREEEVDILQRYISTFS